MYFIVLLFFILQSCNALTETVYFKNKLTASDGVFGTGISGDNFGYSVAVSGNRAVIGAKNVDGGGFSDSGAVYVFTRTGKTWDDGVKLFASDPAAGDTFGYDVAMHGDRIVVGAPGKLTSRGSIYVFTWTGSAWDTGVKLSQIGTATNSDTFGFSVDIHGDRIIAGIPADDDNSLTNSGSVIIFTWTGSAWDTGVKLYATDRLASARFGVSVAIYENRIIAGASAKSTNTGSANIFTWNGTSWGTGVVITAPTPTINTNFGVAVDISDTTAVVGANLAASGNGAIYIFTRSGSTWSAGVEKAGAGNEFNYGGSVSLEGNRLLVGAYNNVQFGTASGSAKLFTWDGVSSWGTGTIFYASDPAATNYFGFGNAISDNFFITSAYGNLGMGAAYVYAWDTDSPTASPTQSPTPDPYVKICSTKVNLAVNSPTARENIVTNTIVNVKNNYTGDGLLKAFVKSTETSFVSLNAVDGNVTKFTEAYAAARGCTPGACTVTVSGLSRRVLEDDNARELQTLVTVSISFDLTEEAYATLVSSGNNLDSPTFLSNLASTMGLNSSDITVTSNGGTVEIEVCLYVYSNGIDPLSTLVLDEIQTLQSSLDNATTILVAELGSGSDSVTLVTINPCNERTCSGNGDASAPGTDSNGCTTATGLCVCLGDWWGINCETPCTCENEGVCVDAYCLCKYPYYGIRCVSTKTCGCAEI